LKVIFWCAAIGDPTLAREEGTQQDGEYFDTVWAPIEEVMSIPSFDDDRKIVIKLLSAAQSL
jgi:hypothetical protein